MTLRRVGAVWWQATTPVGVFLESGGSAITPAKQRLAGYGSAIALARGVSEVPPQRFFGKALGLEAVTVAAAVLVVPLAVLANSPLATACLRSRWPALGPMQAFLFPSRGVAHTPRGVRAPRFFQRELEVQHGMAIYSASK